MSRSIPILFLAAALAGCGSSPPTPQEENLSERATGPDTVPVDAANVAAANATASAGTAGTREGISGATQGPTAGDSDAPYGGEDSRSRNP